MTEASVRALLCYRLITSHVRDDRTDDDELVARCVRLLLVHHREGDRD